MVNDVASQKSCILLVDDHPLILAGLSQLINKQPDLICCGVARTIANAREEFAASRPDLVTIDLGMPDGDSVQLIKDFTSERPSMPILVVSQWDETIYAERVLKAGARGLCDERTLCGRHSGCNPHTFDPGTICQSESCRIGTPANGWQKK